MPGPGVVGVVLTAPLHAVRVRQGSRQRSRWSRCHAPCWAAPGVPLRCAVGGAPHLSRAVLRPRCARARPAPVAPCLAMSNALDAAMRLPSPCHRPPTGYVTELAEPSSAPSPPALSPRHRDRPCGRPFPASQGHEPRHQRCHGSCSYPPAVSCSLRASAVMRAHYHIRHRARHGLRGGVAIATSTLRSCCPMRHTHRVNA